ncbi:MAG: hypothetical protein HQM11_01990 [SAR324 cluster bacterium]|nr:hypothetical protein [SAR324 cluster bacterium]
MFKTVSEAKANLNAIVATDELIFLTKNGKTISSLVPYELFQEMYRAWKDLQYRKAIVRAKVIHAGNTDGLVSDEELDALLNQYES